LVGRGRDQRSSTSVHPANPAARGRWRQDRPRSGVEGRPQKRRNIEPAKPQGKGAASGLGPVGAEGREDNCWCWRKNARVFLTPASCQEHRAEVASMSRDIRAVNRNHPLRQGEVRLGPPRRGERSGRVGYADRVLAAQARRPTITRPGIEGDRPAGTGLRRTKPSRANQPAGGIFAVGRHCAPKRCGRRNRRTRRSFGGVLSAGGFGSNGAPTVFVSGDEASQPSLDGASSPRVVHGSPIKPGGGR